MLKADLHVHAKEDREDKQISYTAKQLLDHARSLNFDVISFTFHKLVFWNKEIRDYAKKKQIILIPGCEMTVEGVHVLIYNVDPEKLKGIVNDIQCADKISAIKELKADSVVIAPHPFYRHQFIRKRLGDCLEKNITAFDGIEYCHFYYKSLSYNSAAVRLAKKYGKPIIGTGDVHRLYQQGHTYTMIDSRPERAAVLDAIRKGKVDLVTKSLPLGLFLKHGILSAVT